MENGKEFLQLFGENVARIRKDKNLSVRKLAQLCDIDYSDISKYEKGLVNVQLLTIIELAKGLDVKPWELLMLE